MLVTFLRHATAEERRFDQTDAERALTDKGLKQIKRVAELCQAHELSPERLLSSPLLRARQTADELHRRLPGCPPPEIVDWLGLDSGARTVARRLRDLADQGARDVWLVGHEPDFSEAVGLLLGCPVGNLSIKKASLTRLELDAADGEGRGRLLWSVPVKLG